MTSLINLGADNGSEVVPVLAYQCPGEGRGGSVARPLELLVPGACKTLLGLICRRI